MQAHQLVNFKSYTPKIYYFIEVKCINNTLEEIILKIPAWQAVIATNDINSGSNLLPFIVLVYY